MIQDAVTIYKLIIFMKRTGGSDMDIEKYVSEIKESILKNEFYENISYP